MKKAYGVNNKQVDFSKYCYEEVQNLINIGYAKEIKEGKAHTIGYPGWSPNNVRRVIISSMGVIVQYHTTKGMKNGQIFKFTRFNRKKAYDCMQSQDYIPMMKALVGVRVCSGIEEIILLRAGINHKELNFGGIGIQTLGDANEGIKKRFKRLYAVSIVNVEIQQILDLVNEMKKNDFLITEHLKESDMSRCVERVYYFNKDNWLTNKPNLQPVGVDGKGYIEDKEEGALGAHFKRLITIIKEEEKKQSIKKFELERKQRIREADSEELQKVEQQIKLLELSIKGFRIYSELCKSERIKSRLTGYVATLDIDTSDLIRLYAFGDKLSITKELRKIAVSLSNYKGVDELLKEGDYTTSRALKSCIETYFEVSTKTQASDVSTALNCMTIAMIKGLIKAIYESIENIRQGLPKFVKTITRNTKSNTFYLCENYSNILGFSEIFSNTKKLEGINEDILAENLSILFTVHSELFLIQGSGYRRNSVQDWYNKLTQ